MLKVLYYKSLRKSNFILNDYPINFIMELKNSTIESKIGWRKQKLVCGTSVKNYDLTNIKACVFGHSQ
jgi:hypothetical protein